jgi:hypothetical protein
MRDCALTILRLFWEPHSGALGVKEVIKWLNSRGSRTRKGKTFGVGSIYKILTNTTYMGEWKFNRMSSRTGKWKADEEVVTSAVPAIIEPHLFEQVQRQLHARSPKVIAPRVTTGPILLTGLAVCATKRRNDAADRHLEDRCRPSLLYVLDLRPKGQDGLQGPVDTDSEAGHPRHHPHDRTAVPAGAAGHDLVLAGITTFGKGGRGECPCNRFAARGHRRRRQTQAPVSADRGRHEGNRRRPEGSPKLTAGRSGPRQGRARTSQIAFIASDPDRPCFT